MARAGLSLTHFQRLGMMDRYKAVSQAASLSSGFSVPPPPAPMPRSWGELGAIARSFVAYAEAVCDPVTVTLATALNEFVAEVEGGGQLVEDDLPMLVWWINNGLEKYRNAAAHDVTDAGLRAPRRLIVFLRQMLSSKDWYWLFYTASGEGTAPLSTKPQGRIQFERKIPKEVLEYIPTRDNKEVCLHFLSKKGCSSKDPTSCTSRNRVLFWPKQIPEKVRDYIATTLDGP
ncbi:hypothetical protein PHMEG_00035553 [Phytophthora megakarya]|uniref:Uncharacterized protein n=1 Tax=Phytophthora megakarya TaxID=4795 RepID=A0A225UQ26_9STRA|nr:hypothetical protein PHMEG_00035553 [Phytophthora megakarya]